MWVVAGVVLVLPGLLWTLQGVGGVSVGASPDGAPVGRRVVLGLLGLGAVGVVTGSRVQAGLSDLLAPVQLRDPTGLTSLVPLGDTWRYYSVTGAVAPRDAASYTLKVSGLVHRPATYSLADLEALPQKSFTDTFQCVTGWRVPDVSWTGVRLADLLDRQPRPARRSGCGSVPSTVPTR